MTLIWGSVSGCEARMDRLILSRSQGLGYCLKDQMNNRQGSFSLLLLTLCCLGHFRCLLYPLLSLQSFKTVLPHPSWPLQFCITPSVPVLLHSSNPCPLPLHPGTNSGPTCPDCCCWPIILQCCLPSGHLAPHHSRGDFRLTVLPLARLRQTEGQSGGRRCVCVFVFCGGLHRRLSQFHPWKTAGQPLTSLLVGVTPVTAAIRTKSLAGNMTRINGIWPKPIGLLPLICVGQKNSLQLRSCRSLVYLQWYALWTEKN